MSVYDKIMNKVRSTKLKADDQFTPGTRRRYSDVITLPVDWMPRLTNRITNIQARTKHRHKCHRTSPRFSMLMSGSSFISANLQHTHTYSFSSEKYTFTGNTAVCRTSQCEQAQQKNKIWKTIKHHLQNISCNINMFVQGPRNGVAPRSPLL